MTKADRIKINDILDALTKQNTWTVLNRAATLAFQAANREPDQSVKAKLLVLAGEIQSLHKETP